MQHNKLVTMVNQIAEFHHRLPEQAASAEVAHHMELYWELRMRQAIYAHLDAGGEGLSATSRAAVILLRARDAGKQAFEPEAA